MLLQRLWCDSATLNTCFYNNNNNNNNNNIPHCLLLEYSRNVVHLSTIGGKCSEYLSSAVWKITSENTKQNNFSTHGYKHTSVSEDIFPFQMWQNPLKSSRDYRTSAAEIVYSAYLPCQFRLSVRPSVCLSHARFVSKRLNASSKFFQLSDKPIILVFLSSTKGRGVNLSASPPTGVPNTRGDDFLPARRCILETAIQA